MSNDGVRLRVNGQLLIDNWTPHAATEDSGTIALQGGQWYPLTLEYFEGSGTAQISLSYAAPGVPKQIIPAANLRTTAGAGATPTPVATAPAASSTPTPVATAPAAPVSTRRRPCCPAAIVSQPPVVLARVALANG